MEKEKIKVQIVSQVKDFIDKEFSMPSIMRRIKDLYYIIFCDFWHKLSRSTSWFFFMWSNNEWDQVYLYKVLHKRLVEFEKHMRIYGHHITAKSHAKLMRYCIWYLDRLINEDACDKLYYLHEKKYGNLTWEHIPEEGNKQFYTVKFGFEKCDTTEKYKYVDKVYMRIHKIECYRYKKYKDKLFYILNKYINCWWS